MSLIQESRYHFNVKPLSKITDDEETKRKKRIENQKRYMEKTKAFTQIGKIHSLDERIKYITKLSYDKDIDDEHLNIIVSDYIYRLTNPDFFSSPVQSIKYFIRSTEPSVIENIDDDSFTKLATEFLNNLSKVSNGS